MNEATVLLKEIRDLLREIRDAQRASGTVSSSGKGKSGGGEVADDRDLDGDHGNPSIRKDPPRWTGPSYVGCTFSECPPEYLDQVADLFDWMADKDEQAGKKAGNGKPSAPYKRRDAARARGWAMRIRKGWRPPERPADENHSGPPPNDDGFIPF